MSTIYGMNSKTEVNPSRPGSSDPMMYDPATGEQALYICQPDKGKTRVLSSYGEGSDFQIGARAEWVTDTGMGHRNGGMVTVVGIVHADGRTEGTIPTRTSVLWVAK